MTCVECHTDTTLGSATVVAGNWPNDKCTDCHDAGAASTHDAYEHGPYRLDPARGCAGSGSICHGTTTNLAVLHNAEPVRRRPDARQLRERRLPRDGPGRL